MLRSILYMPSLARMTVGFRTVHTTHVLAFLLVPFLVFGHVRESRGQSEAPDARTIVDRAESLMRGESQRGEYRMRIVTPDWERSIRFEFWAEGTERSFIRIHEPARDRGVGFLKLGNEMWNYVPRINRVVKIPPSMMMQSWMGSDFTNDDLAQASSLRDDYAQVLEGIETIRGDDAYKVQLEARPDAAVAWDVLLYWVRVNDFVPMRAEYFNERGETVRVMEFTEVRRMGDRMIPTVMEVRRPQEESRATVLELIDMEFDVSIPSSVFTMQNLQRTR